MSSEELLKKVFDEGQTPTPAEVEELIRIYDRKDYPEKYEYPLSRLVELYECFADVVDDLEREIHDFLMTNELSEGATTMTEALAYDKVEYYLQAICAERVYNYNLPEEIVKTFFDVYPKTKYVIRDFYEAKKKYESAIMKYIRNDPTSPVKREEAREILDGLIELLRNYNVFDESQLYKFDQLVRRAQEIIENLGDPHPDYLHRYLPTDPVTVLTDILLDVETFNYDLHSKDVTSLAKEFAECVNQLENLLTPDAIHFIQNPIELDEETLKRVQICLQRVREILRQVEDVYAIHIVSEGIDIDVYDQFMKFFKSRLGFDPFRDTEKLITFEKPGYTENEFLDIMYEKGYDYCDDKNNYLVFCKDIDSEHWMKVYVPVRDGIIYVEKDGRIQGSYIVYGTSKEVPGWCYCRTNGEWYSERECEERCPEEPFEEFYL